MKTVFKNSLILMIFTVLSGWLLSVTYKKTNPLIKKHIKEKKIEERKRVLPEAIKFNEVTFEEKRFFIGYNKNGKICGYVFPIDASGYASKIDIMIGITPSNQIKEVSITNQQETPGLGSRITEEWFLTQFEGLKEQDIILKKDSSNGKINAITGATISSRAVVNGIKKAFSILKKYIDYKEKEKFLDNLQDGKYFGTANGFNGPIAVEVEVKNKRIKKITIIKQNEMQSYWKKVIDILPEKILSKQSISIDVVSSATVSSKGFLNAIMEALKKARR